LVVVGMRLLVVEGRSDDGRGIAKVVEGQSVTEQ
jgi:hypothetical protein